MIKSILERKKLIIAAVIIIAIILSFVYMVANADGKGGISVQGFVPEKRDIKSTISATGMVQSVNNRSVYSTQAAQVKTVNVSVGDIVADGDTLAQLDTTDLELQISQQRATLNAQSSSAGQQINVAQHNLQNAQFTTDAGLNAQIINAQASVDSAKISVQMAEQDVKTAWDAWRDSGSSPSSTYDYPTGSATLPDGASSVGGSVNGGGSFSQTGDGIPTTDSNKTQLKNAYDKAVLAKKNADQQLITAEKQLQATLAASGIEISTYEQQLKSAQVSNNYTAQEIAIQLLEKSLSDATITSPISGTVTAVYAEEGGSGSGLLFVIEDTNSLEIETSVSEYDLLNVVPGMKVSVKTDATGDEEFDGVVSKVSPTALKSQTGENVATTNSQFGVTISVDSGNQKLKVGMNAKLELISEERSNVYAISYDALQTNNAGENIIYMLSKDQEGKDIAVSKVVKTGVETDFYIELVDIEFTDNDVILTSAEPLQDGASVYVINGMDLGLVPLPESSSKQNSEESGK